MSESRFPTPGYYWCSHDLAWVLPPGETYPRQWTIVERTLEGEILLISDEYPVADDKLPDYVTFVGPLSPPEAA